MRETLRKIPPPDIELAEYAQKRLDSLTKPPGSLGRLEECAKKIVSVTGSSMPDLDKKVIFTFAGDHGVTEEGVSAFPREVTPQMVLNFLSGGAAINVLARHSGAEVVVIDIGVDYDFSSTHLPPLTKGLGGHFHSRKVMRGTGNIRKGPAMTRHQAEKCVTVGITIAEEYSKKGYKIFGTGDMGIGNTTPSAAIASVLTGLPVSEVTGRGTGISDETLLNKIRVIEDSIATNKPDPANAIDVLSKVGGAEIGGIAGLILGAAANRIPVVIDGFISTAGALLAYHLEPKTKDCMFAAHRSVERGHTAVLEAIGLTPLLDLGMRLGEGTGAALAMHIIEAGIRIYRDMATFAEAGVAEGM